METVQLYNVGWRLAFSWTIRGTGGNQW